ncbi:PAP2 superfamily protein [Mucilaginibacter gracilis]|uniref:PAP2 superfamily protein n=1 Tax=Mucilaginibacter gracilis TaxID=423350 RepID=A0A495J203_9SPHI|nr:phosphatase PAP2 family protein [Mucilaginibacter gracilis]RKR83006.1 PAP2 superfamily protein [Mucilaginibacter gracilis]
MSNGSAANGAVSINRKTITVTCGVSAAYLLLSALVVGYKTDQLVLVLLFNLAFYASAISRKFITGFAIFIVYWITYDYMKAFPNYNYSAVHIADLYHTEKHIFGINISGKVLTPNEYWRYNGNSFLDLMCGIFYLCWIPVPMAFAVYLFFKKRRQFLLFLLTFVLVNFIGFIIYYTFAAAPPWYVAYKGFNFVAHTPGNTAGLAKFDAYFNIGLFKSIYAKGSNVFAAMPSLHSSYPVIVLYYGLKNKLGVINVFFATVTVGIWFAAVYLSHHYVLDVLAGITCAIVGIALFNLLLSRSGFFKRFIDGYERAIM